MALNGVAPGLRGGRLDLTQDRLFTLSPGTEQMLKALPKPVTLTFYNTPDLGRTAPAYAFHAERVRDMLHLFQRVSNGAVTVVEVAPEPFFEAEDRAVAAGLQGVPLGAGGERAYFGVSGGPADKPSAAIPFLQIERETFLETTWRG